MTDIAGATVGPARLTAAHIGLAAIGLMWTLPFLQPIHAAPLTSFYGDWLTLALGLLALGTMAGRSCWQHASFPVLALPLAGFVVVIAIQYGIGRIVYGGQALAVVLYLAWAILMAALAATLRRAIGLEGMATVLAWFVAVAGVLAAVLGVLQHYQISDLPHTLVVPKLSAAVYGNLAQYNHFANFCSLALASLAFLYASRRVHWAAVAAGAAPIVFVIGVSGSRSSLLFLAVLILLALLYAWRGGAGGRRLWVTVTLFAAGFALAQWLATAPGLAAGSATETVSQRLMGGEGSSGAINIAHRLQLAREAWEMFLATPLLGAGWGQFPWHDFSYRALNGPPIETWPFNHAHNIVLHLLAVTGLAGTLLVAGSAALWAWGLRRAAVDLTHWWLLALLAVIAVHSLLEHPLWFANFLGIAAVVLGLSSGDNLPMRLGRAGRVVAPLVAAAGLLYLLLIMSAYRGFERLFLAAPQLPGANEYHAILARAHREPLLRPYAELAIASGLPLDGGRLREKLELNGRVMRFAPVAGVVYRQAILLALAGEADAAASQFSRAARVYPIDLPTAIRILNEHAPRHPVELTPLIKLAEIEIARRRAAQGRR